MSVLHSVLHDDPYRLLAFATFAKVDAIARRAGVPVDDPRRGVGAVEAAVHAAADRGESVLHHTEMVSQVTARLGWDVPTVAQAIDRAREAGVLYALGDQRWVGEAAWRCCAWVNDRLGNLRNSGLRMTMEEQVFHEDGPIAISSAVRAVGTTTLSHVSAATRATRTAFSVALRDAWVEQGRRLHIIADSSCLATYLEVALKQPVAVVDRETLEVDVAGDTVLWLSSHRQLRSFARVLARWPELERLIVLDDGRVCRSSDDVEVPCEVHGRWPSLQLHAVPSPDDGWFAHMNTAARWACVKHARPYQARAGQREGVWWLQVGPDAHLQAVIGVCYQQAALGTVALVIDEAHARAQAHTMWQAALAGLPSPIGADALTIMAMADLESEDVATVVLSVPLSSPPLAWWAAALGNARERVIVVAANRPTPGTPIAGAACPEGLALVCQVATAEQGSAYHEVANHD